ncbi:MAG: hypothetical protein VYD99_02595 [Planctomycetota bacterium]|nr:hypothetical protein [Planctomycetota bacterium]
MWVEPDTSPGATPKETTMNRVHHTHNLVRRIIDRRLAALLVCTVASITTAGLLA